MNISTTTTDGCAAVESSLAVEDGSALAQDAQTGDSSTETTTPGSSGSDESNGKTARVRPADRLAQLATVEGWLVFLVERVNEAVEQATKDDSAFEPPMKVEEVKALLADGLALIVPEVAPKLEALAKACAGARDARLKREAAHRVSCKRTKAAQSKVAKDRAAAEAEAEALRAKLRSLETALGKTKAETPAPEAAKGELAPKTEPTS